MPATQIHSLRVQLTLKEDRHGWRQTGGENKEWVRKNNKRSAASFGQPYLFPSIYGNCWIIYKPLPLALCEGVSVREGRGYLLSSLPPCCVLLLSAQLLLLLSGCWQYWALACLFQLRTTQSQASPSAVTASTDRRLLREPPRGRRCAHSATDCPGDKLLPLCPNQPVTQLSTLPSISAMDGQRERERRGKS